MNFFVQYALAFIVYQ